MFKYVVSRAGERLLSWCWMVEVCRFEVCRNPFGVRFVMCLIMGIQLGSAGVLRCVVICIRGW